MLVLENLLLSIATVVGLAGIAVYEAAADWHLPGLVRASLPLLVAVIVLALLWMRGRLRAGAPSDPSEEASASRSRAWAGNIVLAAVCVALSPYWLPWVRTSPVPLRARLVGSFFGVGAALIMGVRVWARRRLPFRPAVGPARARAPSSSRPPSPMTPTSWWKAPPSTA